METSVTSSQRRPVRRVLLVDDNDTCRDVYSMVLEDAGYQVIPAENGLDAVTALDHMAQPPDAIVLDLVMPIMDGWQFMDVLKGRHLAEPIPILITSASHQPGLRGIEAAFLPKPVDPDELVAKVASIAGNPKRERPGDT
jgi:CheY-like chemotaxis protein